MSIHDEQNRINPKSTNGQTPNGYATKGLDPLSPINGAQSTILHVLPTLRVNHPSPFTAVLTAKLGQYSYLPLQQQRQARLALPYQRHAILHWVSASWRTNVPFEDTFWLEGERSFTSATNEWWERKAQTLFSYCQLHHRTCRQNTTTARRVSTSSN